MQVHFGMTDLHLTDEDKRSAVDVYLAIDLAIWTAQRAESLDPCFEDCGIIELLAWLYCAAADIWRGIDNDMTREEAIVIAERCFHDIYLFYSRR